MRTLSTLLLLTIALTAGTEGIAAQKKSARAESPTPPALSVMQESGVTLSQAVEQVRRQYKGTIVSAKTRCNGSRETHEIKVLTDDGRVKTVRVPGKRCG
jgi:hypothetical protein